jgi:hypothetical protein
MFKGEQWNTIVYLKLGETILERRGGLRLLRSQGSKCRQRKLHPRKTVFRGPCIANFGKHMLIEALRMWLND